MRCARASRIYFPGKLHTLFRTSSHTLNCIGRYDLETFIKPLLRRFRAKRTGSRKNETRNNRYLDDLFLKQLRQVVGGAGLGNEFGEMFQLSNFLVRKIWSSNK